MFSLGIKWSNFINLSLYSNPYLKSFIWYDTIYVLNVPKLVIELDSPIIESRTEFLVTIRDENANRWVDVTVAFYEQTCTSSIDGEVNLIAPNEVWKYNIISSFLSRVNATTAVIIIYL